MKSESGIHSLVVEWQTLLLHGVKVAHEFLVPLVPVRVRMEQPVFTFMERRMKEEWKTLIYQQKSFPDFEVSNIGRLRNLNSGIIYQQYLNRLGQLPTPKGVMLSTQLGSLKISSLHVKTEYDMIYIRE